MIKSPSSLIALAVALALAGGTAALAQSSHQVAINASVPEILNLSVDTNTVTLALTQADYNTITGAGSKEALAATTFKVSANRSWRLRASANSATFTYNGSSFNPLKLCRDLAIRPPGGIYRDVTIGNIDVASGSRGGYDARGNTIPVDYKLVSTLDRDPAGTYTLTLTFTLTAG